MRTLRPTLVAALLLAACQGQRTPGGTTGTTGTTAVPATTGATAASTGTTTGGQGTTASGATSGGATSGGATSGGATSGAATTTGGPTTTGGTTAASSASTTGPATTASSASTTTGGATTTGGTTTTGGGTTAASTSTGGTSAASTTTGGATTTGGPTTASSASTTTGGGSTTSTGGTTGAATTGGPTGGAGADTPPWTTQSVAAQLAASPTTPSTEAGQPLSWPAAPELTPVQVEVNRDSVILDLPAVAGAKDYRAFRLPAGVSLNASGGGEQVQGTTLFCAGMRQRSGPAPATPEPLQQVEVTGLTGPTTLVVEALDAACPFPGVLGATHQEVQVSNPEVDAAAQGTLRITTEAEQRTAYGSLIINGQGWGPTPGQPAPTNNPHVLARTTVVVTPLGTAHPPLAFFDDFSTPGQPTLVGPADEAGRSQQGKLFQSQNWSIYSYGADAAQFFVDRGGLTTVLADWGQDIFSTNIAYPRRPVALSATDYLHAAFEVSTDATGRRYWELFLCGAETAGATMDASGVLKGRIVETPFFYQPDGQDPSVEGWNCLLVFPRGGWPFPLPPSNTNPESDVQVVLNQANKPDRSSVVDVSPDQYHDPAIAPPSWYRQMRADGTLTGPMLDDQMRIAPRTRYDFYIRRDRVVMFVNGEQRLCNDFPAHALTMAEGALGFGQVFYHSAAERQELQVDYWDRTGQLYYLHDTPFVDSRTWDNLGFQEHVPAPAQFDPGGCFVAP